MLRSFNVFAAAAPGGLVSVGAGWPSPTAWAVAGLAVGVLALIARWASGPRHRRRDADVPSVGAVSSRCQPISSTQRGLTQKAKQTGKEQP